MTIGPGKYDDLCTVVRTATGAPVVAVIIFGGTRGSGFSVQMEERHAGFIARLPDMLEEMAKQIRSDLEDTNDKAH